MNKKLLVAAVGVIAVLGVVVALMVNQGERREDTDVIRIGAILPLTGPSAYLGEDERNSLLLAQEKINTGENGLRVSFVFADSAGNAKDGISAYQKMKLENIKYLITSTTQVSEAINQICKNDIYLQTANSAHPEITLLTENLIRCFYGFEQESEVAMPFFIERGVKKVAFLFVDTAQTKFVIEEIFIPKLKEANIEVSAVETYKMSDTSFRDSLVKVNASSPEYIFTMDYGNMYPAMLREAEQMGIRTKIMGGLIFATAPDLPNELKTGIVFVAPLYLLGKNQAYSEFIKEYESRYTTNITPHGVFSYDTALLLSEHLKNGNVTKNKIVNTSFEGISGNIQFDHSGRAKVEMTLATFDPDGSIKKYEVNHE